MHITIINNNNFLMTQTPAHVFIKSILLKRKEYLSIQKEAKIKYSRCNHQEFPLETFQAWSLLAIILGIFTHLGDTTSTNLFFNCLKSHYLPKIYISECNKFVRVHIYIFQKELDQVRIY